jgi:hypothetical protein
MTSSDSGRTPHPTRAGAMTMAMRAAQMGHGTKALRIGITQGGKLLHDRVLARTEAVSIGRSERNTFVLATPRAPTSFVLIEPGQSGPILRFPLGGEGRLASELGNFTLAELVASGRAIQRGDVAMIALSDAMRGKLVFGDVTVLLEVVDTPARRARPELPMAVRQGFARSIDWLFTAFVLGSFLAHFGFVIYLNEADWPVADASEDIVRAAELIMEMPEPPDVPEPPAPSDPEADTTPEPDVVADPRPTPKPAHPSDGGKPAPSSADTASLADEAARSAQLMLTGALGANGALHDLLREGGPTDRAEDVFAMVQGAQIGSAGQTGFLPGRDVGEGKPRGLDGLHAVAVAPVRDVGPVVEREIKAAVNLEGGEDVGGHGEIDADAVTRAIKLQLGRIRSCYDSALRHDPALQGKVTVAFTVEQSGTFSHVSVEEDTVQDAGLARCVRAAVSGIRLREGPEGGSVDFRYPFVFKPGT